MPFTYNESEWPILLIQASGQSTDEDLREYLQTLHRVLMKHERHVVIVDATAGQNLKGTHRKMVADWNESNARKLTRYRAGLVLVTPNAVLRGIITAVYWLFSPPFPNTAVNTVAEARQWALKQLAER